MSDTLDLEIWTGGQTGVDRAAMDAAIAAGIPTGGWCPAGRRAEDGTIPDQYPLRETPSRDYGERTRLNVLDTHGLLILDPDVKSEGTCLALQAARAAGRPRLVLDPRHAEPRQASDWIEREEIVLLNVAGPRESEAPGVYAAARAFVDGVLADLRSKHTHV